MMPDHVLPSPRSHRARLFRWGPLALAIGHQQLLSQQLELRLARVQLRRQALPFTHHTASCARIAPSATTRFDGAAPVASSSRVITNGSMVLAM